MKNSSLFLFNKDILSLIFTTLFSLTIFFSNNSEYVHSVEEDIIDFISIIAYPKKWYNKIFIIRENNKISGDIKIVDSVVEIAFRFVFIISKLWIKKKKL